MICGIPDAQWGDQIVLILAGHGLAQHYATESIDIASLLAECFAQSLQKHEVPRRFFIVETVPMTSSGKVAYRELQRQLGGFTEVAMNTNPP